MPRLPELPIDSVLDRVVATVRERRIAVLVAPPGAGKTTRVPGALLDSGAIDGEIVVLQPRRIAARMAAARIASERGCDLGGEVGYEVRFDRKRSAATRIALVTEGVLTRRLLADPLLRGVGCVVIDEFHERHLDGDLALALLARLRANRPELALIVMSATLDAEPVAAFLGAEIVRSEGRTFPLTIEHSPDTDERPLAKQVVNAVRRAAQGGLDGDILVFLPGAGEIRRCGEELGEVASLFDLEVLPLHGELSTDEQDRAVRPSARRKVILATNVAETSLTIDGVTCVIDSGLARIARHSPWSGLPSLQIQPVSRASCTQRAGRAGRTRPGRVIRLYTKHDHDTRRAFDAPEIERADLAAVALELAVSGVGRAGDLRWFQPPPEPAVAAAEQLLVRLGAIANDGAPTEIGRALSEFPIHPRLARIAVEGIARGVVRDACTIAAVIEARELRSERRGGEAARVASDSDILDDLDALAGRRRDGVDRATGHQVERVARQLERVANASRYRRSGIQGMSNDAALRLAILTGFPDRVGRRRAPRSAEIVFAGGGSGTLAPVSAVLDSELMVAVDVAETGSRGQASRVSIRRASAIDPAWLLDLYMDHVVDRDELMWNGERQRVERVTQLVYDGLVIDEQRDVEGARRAGAAASELLAKHALAAGIENFVDGEALAHWRARVGFAARFIGGLAAPTDDMLGELIGRACAGAISFAELRASALLDLLDATLAEHRSAIDRVAPTHLALPHRKRVAIHYELDRPPWIASRIQDFFGLARPPTVGDGQVAVVLHLLAPNQRPVQVTQDLPGFWSTHYPALRKQLMRRYPKHAWPEDPTAI